MYLAHVSKEVLPSSSERGQKTVHVRLPFCVHAGANLFRDGDDCSGLFEIVSGVMLLSRLTRAGRRCVIGFGFPGDILGYSAGQCHISDCDAVTETKVIRHRPDVLLNESGQMHDTLLNAALRQVEAMQDHCMVLGCVSARDRVAAFLSLLGNRIGTHAGGRVGFDLPMSRADIADYLGLTTETVSRSLTELRQAKLIAIERVHHVVLLQPNALDALAEGDTAPIRARAT
jgi:CRP-like cAMP-binding protein